MLPNKEGWHTKNKITLPRQAERKTLQQTSPYNDGCASQITCLFSYHLSQQTLSCRNLSRTFLPASVDSASKLRYSTVSVTVKHQGHMTDLGQSGCAKIIDYGDKKTWAVIPRVQFTHQTRQPDSMEMHLT